MPSLHKPRSPMRMIAKSRLRSAAGAFSVISKDIEPKLLMQILRHVADSHRSSPPASYGPELSQEITNIAKAAHALTDRERQIIRLVSEGLSNKQIASRLNITDGTIKIHLHHIFQKLEVSNRTVLAISQIPKVDAPQGYGCEASFGALLRTRSTIAGKIRSIRNR